MKIQRDEHGRKGAFFIDEDGEWIAELAYARTGGNMIVIDHTEVDEKLRGENIGRDLIAEAVRFARENGLKIRAACPYARKVLENAPEYSDVYVAGDAAASPPA